MKAAAGERGEGVNVCINIKTFELFFSADLLFFPPRIFISREYLISRRENLALEDEEGFYSDLLLLLKKKKIFFIRKI